jgi:hypothetical protein
MTVLGWRVNEDGMKNPGFRSIKPGERELGGVLKI